MKYISLIIILFVISFNSQAENRVGGGGVWEIKESSFGIVEKTIPHKNKAGTGRGSFTISKKTFMELKKLGVEQLILKNGETLDLNGGEGAGE